MPEPVTYLDLAAVAEALGIRQGTLYTIRYRYRDRQPPWPGPDVLLGGREGWHPDRLPEIRAWLAARPQQAGGGRPGTQAPGK